MGQREEKITSEIYWRGFEISFICRAAFSIVQRQSSHLLFRWSWDRISAARDLSPGVFLVQSDTVLVVESKNVKLFFMHKGCTETKLRTR